MFALVAIAVLFAADLTSGECATSDRSENIWERAKSNAARPYCDLIASGVSKLSSPLSGPLALEQVLVLADQAEKANPKGIMPHVLRGAALVRLERHAQAYTELKLVPHSDPQILLSWARALRGTGRTKEARDAYRQVLPMLSSIAGSDRGRVLAEAAFLAMADGPSGLDEAIASFREAKRIAQEPVAMLGLALALDRRGDVEESRFLLTQAPDDVRDLTRRSIDVFDARDPAATAMLALALESKKSKEAKAQWLLVTQGPWLAHAANHATKAGK